jgi:Metalloenzyme superfamily
LRITTGNPLLLQKIRRMKNLLFVLSSFICLQLSAQKDPNIIIITTDGFRWQELFGGMDSALANNARFNQGDSAGMYKKYWAATEQERRQKLLPFLWTTLNANGQIYGNRQYSNQVNNANRYWFSYPGYNEIFTGYPDTLVNSNSYKPNPHTTLLDFFQGHPAYQNRVAAFGAWDAFARILNRERSGFLVVNAFDTLENKKASAEERLLYQLLQDSYRPFGDAECLDVFTHYLAMDYLKTRKPKVLYIGYGETDEWAHHGQYKDYLNAAKQVDQWIGDIWQYVQSDPLYKDNTFLFITTDHGRGDTVKTEWTDHGAAVKGAGEIWFAVLGPGIQPLGEIKTPMQLYQKQFAQTMAALLGKKFMCEHEVGEGIELVR